MIIREAQSKDVETIAKNSVELAYETEKKQINYRTTRSGVATVLSDKNKGFILIAEKDSIIIGQLMVTYEWSDWSNKDIWWIQSVFVKKNYRRTGVFTALFKEVKKKAIQQDIDIIRLYTKTNNKHAKNAYLTLAMNEKPYIIYETTTS